MGHGKRGVFCSRVLAERVGTRFGSCARVCPLVARRGASGPAGGDARRAEMPGERTARVHAPPRCPRWFAPAGLTKEQKRKREYNCVGDSKTVRCFSRVEISSWLYSPFLVCDHVQFTWYTCSCGQIFNFFVATHRRTHLDREPGKRQQGKSTGRLYSSAC